MNTKKIAVCQVQAIQAISIFLLTPFAFGR
jgi:hypothetical protein